MREFNRHFTHFFATVSTRTVPDCLHPAIWQPPLDIYELENSILVVVELPGVEKDQISVAVKDGILTISGCRSKHIPRATQHIHQMEILYGPFARAVQLPPCADIDRIEAQFDQGYLSIEIPRGSRR